MDEKRIVEAVDLKIHFPLEDNTVKAVDGISFHIDRGETLAVVGESGSGKSVTAMGLMRLNDYAGGKIVGGSARIRRMARLSISPPLIRRRCALFAATISP